MPERTITINRAPLQTLRAVVVAEVLGSDGVELRAGRTGEEDRV